MPVLNSGFSRREWMASALALGAGGAGVAFGQAGGPALTAPAGSLRALADSKGLICGADVDVTWLNDKPQIAALRTDCNVIGIANGFTWQRTQRTGGGPLNFGEVDAIYAMAQAGGQKVRGHNLVWRDLDLQKWILALEPTMTAGEAAKMMTGYIGGAMTQWRGRIIQQDVVNEPIDSNGWQNQLWYRKLGDRYIDLAFHAAAAADPACGRVLNQDRIEMNSRQCELRRTYLLKLLEGALSRGAPIQILGIEGHLRADEPFSESVWRTFLDEVTGMGLKIMVTEYDVLDRGLPGDIRQRDAGAAALLGDFLTTTLSYRQCLGVCAQNWVDRNTWLRVTPDAQRSDKMPVRPDPLDDDYQRKPMWYAVANAIRTAAAR